MLFISLNASCQILPLKTPNFDCPNGAYKKDLDNIFLTCRVPGKEL